VPHVRLLRTKRANGEPRPAEELTQPGIDPQVRRHQDRLPVSQPQPPLPCPEIGPPTGPEPLRRIIHVVTVTVTVTDPEQLPLLRHTTSPMMQHDLGQHADRTRNAQNQGSAGAPRRAAWSAAGAIPGPSRIGV